MPHADHGIQHHRLVLRCPVETEPPDEVSVIEGVDLARPLPPPCVLEALARGAGERSYHRRKSGRHPYIIASPGRALLRCWQRPSREHIVPATAPTVAVPVVVQKNVDAEGNQRLGINDGSLMRHHVPLGHHAIVLPSDVERLAEIVWEDEDDADL